MIGLILKFFASGLARALAPFLKLFAAFGGGWLARGRHEAAKDMKANIKTRERIDDALSDLGDDPAAARRLLAERAKER